MGIDPLEDPPIKPGQPSEPPQESPPGSPRPEVPPPMRDPGEAPSPEELPGRVPDELPVRGPPPGSPGPSAAGHDGVLPDRDPRTAAMPQRTMPKFGLKPRSECAMNAGAFGLSVARNKYESAFEGRHNPA
jgi:hypothetical protein